MPLPTSGPLSLADIQTEFGGANPISLNEYYAGGAFVPAGTSGTNGPVPSSGAISISSFYGTSAIIPFGEAVYTTPGTYSYVVPAGITSICAVAVGGGGAIAHADAMGAAGGGALSYSNNIPVTSSEALTVVVGVSGRSTATGVAINGGDSSISRGGTPLLLARGAVSVLSRSFSGVGAPASTGVGQVRYSGGNGFTIPPPPWNTGFACRSGGGGAAGYGGNGGVGRTAYSLSTGAGPFISAGVGLGGAGGGGGNGTNDVSGGGGGGVGIYGQGANGTAGNTIPGSPPTRGGNGSGGFYPIGPGRDGGWYGGGATSENDDAAHDVSIGGQGAVRIIWGTGKSYPFNAT